MKERKSSIVAKAGLIAAMYVVLTLLSNAFGLASGVIQIRLSEALMILPLFTPIAIYGVTIGCLLSNLLVGACLIDVIFGTLATLIAAVLTYQFRKHNYLSIVFTTLSNALIIPYVLKYGYGLTDSTIPFMMLTVGAGELISCGVLGTLLFVSLKKHKTILS